MKIKISETKKCSIKDPNFNLAEATDEVLLKETNLHKSAVYSCMAFLCSMMLTQAAQHDDTKLGLYFNDFKEALFGGFKNDWFEKHCCIERHHLKKYVPDDVNLIDVLEMVCDCICAGMAREGNYRPIELSNELLQKALHNTEKLIKDNLEVVKYE